MATPAFPLTLRRRPTVSGEAELREATVPVMAEATLTVRPPGRSRRATSYFNTFQTSTSCSTDEPPSYAAAVRAPARPLRFVHDGSERLPPYSCTVGAEGRVLLNVESINPLHGACEGEWREVYLVVRGTMLTFHRVKDGGPGKLLRSYTLQHAEVGLAADVEHTLLVPQTRLAHLIPASARRRAWQKDPDLFQPAAQAILRLRVETDQLLLADGCEERICELVQIISASIDIAPAIDERNIPRQCTVPRRRRRHRPPCHAHMTDPLLLAEQERIFRHMYPDFAGASARPELPRLESHTTLPTTPAREEDEVDLSMIREETAPARSATATTHVGDLSMRPANTRQTTSTTVHSVLSVDMMYSTPTTNFNEQGKWQPPHLRTPAQVQRYIRRCMPTLNAHAARASDILIADGRRMRVNWRMELLEPWELPPPCYQSHDFSNGTNLARAVSQRSSAASASQPEPQSSTSMLGDCDQIAPLDMSLDPLQLTKVVSAITTDKDTPTRHVANGDDEPKSHHPRQTTPTTVHDVVFCF